MYPWPRMQFFSRAGNVWDDDTDDVKMTLLLGVSLKWFWLFGCTSSNQSPTPNGSLQTASLLWNFGCHWSEENSVRRVCFRTRVIRHTFARKLFVFAHLTLVFFTGWLETLHVGRTEGFILRTFVFYSRGKQNLMSLNRADNFRFLIILFVHHVSLSSWNYTL